MQQHFMSLIIKQKISWPDEEGTSRWLLTVVWNCCETAEKTPPDKRIANFFKPIAIILIFTELQMIKTLKFKSANGQSKLNVSSWPQPLLSADLHQIYLFLGLVPSLILCSINTLLELIRNRPCLVIRDYMTRHNDKMTMEKGEWAWSFTKMETPKWLQRCCWQMLETKCVGDNLKILMTVSAILVTNILYHLT